MHRFLSVRLRDHPPVLCNTELVEQQRKEKKSAKKKQQKLKEKSLVEEQSSDKKTNLEPVHVKVTDMTNLKNATVSGKSSGTLVIEKTLKVPPSKTTLETVTVKSAGSLVSEHESKIVVTGANRTDVIVVSPSFNYESSDDEVVKEPRESLDDEFILVTRSGARSSVLMASKSDIGLTKIGSVNMGKSAGLDTGLTKLGSVNMGSKSAIGVPVLASSIKLSGPSSGANMKLITAKSVATAAFASNMSDVAKTKLQISKVAPIIPVSATSASGDGNNYGSGYTNNGSRYTAVGGSASFFPEPEYLTSEEVKQRKLQVCNFQRAARYFEDGFSVLMSGCCVTLKRVVWYFEEGGVVL